PGHVPEDSPGEEAEERVSHRHGAPSGDQEALAHIGPQRPRDHHRKEKGGRDPSQRKGIYGEEVGVHPGGVAEKQVLNGEREIGREAQRDPEDRSSPPPADQIPPEKRDQRAERVRRGGIQGDRRPASRVVIEERGRRGSRAPYAPWPGWRA